MCIKRHWALEELKAKVTVVNCRERFAFTFHSFLAFLGHKTWAVRSDHYILLLVFTQRLLVSALVTNSIWNSGVSAELSWKLVKIFPKKDSLGFPYFWKKIPFLDFIQKWCYWIKVEKMYIYFDSTCPQWNIVAFLLKKVNKSRKKMYIYFDSTCTLWNIVAFLLKKSCYSDWQNYICANFQKK